MSPTTEMIIQLLPLQIVLLFLAWGNYYLAAKSGRRGWLYVVLTLIPIVGIVVSWYLFYSTFNYILNRLPADAGTDRR